MSQDQTEVSNFTLPEYDHGFFYKKLFEINDNVLKLKNQMVFANNDNNTISDAINYLWEEKIVPYLDKIDTRVTTLENLLSTSQINENTSEQPKTLIENIQENFIEDTQISQNNNVDTQDNSDDEESFASPTEVFNTRPIKQKNFIKDEPKEKTLKELQSLMENKVGELFNTGPFKKHNVQKNHSQ